MRNRWNSFKKYLLCCGYYCCFATTLELGHYLSGPNYQSIGYPATALLSLISMACLFQVIEIDS